MENVRLDDGDRLLFETLCADAPCSPPATGGRSSLAACLRAFSASERLAGANAYECERCCATQKTDGKVRDHSQVFLLIWECVCMCVCVLLIVGANRACLTSE